MNLQNGYKVIYEKIADGERTFFADKLDGADATQIGEAIEIGKYKLVFEKDGKIYGSESGKIEDGVCLEAFNAIFVETEATEETQDPAPANVEPEVIEPEVEPVIEDEEEPTEVEPEEEE
jgi:hypothetical protein